MVREVQALFTNLHHDTKHQEPEETVKVNNGK